MGAGVFFPLTPVEAARPGSPTLILDLSSQHSRTAMFHLACLCFQITKLGRTVMVIFMGTSALTALNFVLHIYLGGKGKCSVGVGVPGCKL